MKQETPLEINLALVQLAAPILFNMPIFFGTNTFDLMSVRNVLKASNCPERLHDSVLDNCEKAGVITFSSDRKFITINTPKVQRND